MVATPGERRSRGLQKTADGVTCSVPTDAEAPIDNTRSHAVLQPVFAQPVATADPTGFRVRHPTDSEDYKTLDELNARHAQQPLPFPMPRGLPEPVLTLADTLGQHGREAENAARAAGRLVLHAVGDTGNTSGPASQNEVADKMHGDFHEADHADAPLFFLHLGDVVYNFGERLYYDQFYDPYRGYPAPIVAIAGNHDGMVAPGTHAITLDGFLANFCADGFRITPETGGLSRTAQIQPGVFFTFEAPFVRILALYSNTLEDPGVISSQGGAFPEIGDAQLTFLRAALARVKSERYAGAFILAHHHPAYTVGSKHGSSEAMRAEIDAICEETGVWPHAVLSGHAHNYQRFTRKRGARQIPYIVAGCGGHAVDSLVRDGMPALRVPMPLASGAADDTVVLDNYDDRNFGYLRLVVDAARLRVEFHPASDGRSVKAPDDSVVVDLATHRIVA